MTKNTYLSCDHSSVCFSASPHAAEAAFRPPTQRQRAAAIRASDPIDQKQNQAFLKDDQQAFPAPMMLPGDDLAEDPEAYTQSFQEWKDGKHRNPITNSKRTIYVMPNPEIDTSLKFMREWNIPQISHKKVNSKHPQPIDIRDYLAAFYHGLEVKMMPTSTLRFVPWEEQTSSQRKSKFPQHIGLQIGDECLGIRTRPSPDDIYKGQLHLPDLLSATMDILPKDAYALVLLTEFDLYEDEDDTFICGRAYGSKRVAVVSSARYNPDLDEVQNIDRIHSWPASHCEEYMNTFLPSHKKKSGRTRTRAAQSSSSPLDPPLGPMKEAISLYRSLPPSSMLATSSSPLWLGRMCRTASHELGHCFGMAHCVYYACSMQGSASVCEDARQPPYLCPVDLAKVLSATSTSASLRYRALLNFCEREELKETLFFAPFAAWIKSRLNSVDGE